MGSSNQINIVKAAVQGLQSLRRPHQVAAARGREIHEVAPKPMVDAVAAAEVNMRAKRTAALEEVVRQPLGPVWFVAGDAGRQHALLE